MASSPSGLPHLRRTSSQEGRSSVEAPPDSNPAHWPSVYSSPADQHLTLPPLIPGGARFRLKKPPSLRNLMRRSRSKNAHSEDDHPTTQPGSASVYPYHQALPFRSAPADITSYDQSIRSHSQPPPGPRAVSANYTTPPSDYTSSTTSAAISSDMYAHGHHQSGTWGGHPYSSRPASTYPPPVQSQWEQRPHSHYAGQPSSSSYGHPNQQPAQGYQHSYHNQPQSQPPYQHSSRNSTARASADSEFDDPQDVAAFAAALSGFSGPSTPFTLQSPQSPQNHPSTYAGAAHASSRTPSHLHIPSSQPVPTTQSNFYLHPPSSNSYTGSSSNFSDNRSPHHAINHAILSIYGDEEDRPPDEELPDYAQSQAEEAAKRRGEAASRAAELEMRWAASRRRG